MKPKPHRLNTSDLRNNLLKALPEYKTQINRYIIEIKH